MGLVETATIFYPTHPFKVCDLTEAVAFPCSIKAI